MISYANSYLLHADSETVIFDDLCGAETGKTFAVFNDASVPFYAAGDMIPSDEAKHLTQSNEDPVQSDTGQKTCYYKEDCSDIEKDANTAAWQWLEAKYGAGAIDGCRKYHSVLAILINGLEDNGLLSNKPNDFRDNIVDQLHAVQCSIDRDDDNIEVLVEALNLVFQQKQRMTSAKEGSTNYKTKLTELQDQWTAARSKFKTKMNDHATKITNYLASSKASAEEHALKDATADLMGTTSARSETKRMEKTIRSSMTDFEGLAYKLKRDAIRWSQLNQIANEKERKQYLIENVKAKAYAVLNTCMINYQLEYDA